VRRRVSISSETIRRRLSQTQPGSSATDGELAQLREETSRRRQRKTINTNKNRGKNDDARMQRRTLTNSVNAMGHSVENKTGSELQRRRDEARIRQQRDKEGGNNGSRGKKTERRMTESLISSSNDHFDFLDADKNLPKRSHSCIGCSSHNLQVQENEDKNAAMNDSQHDESKGGERRQHQRTSSRDKTSIGNHVQFDSKPKDLLRKSCHDVPMKNPFEKEDNEEDTPPRRRTPQRRNSLEASLKLGENTKKELLHEWKAKRRRSCSMGDIDSSLPTSDEETTILRSLSINLGDASETDPTEDDLLRLFGNCKKTDKRKTHIGGSSNASFDRIKPGDTESRRNSAIENEPYCAAEDKKTATPADRRSSNVSSDRIKPGDKKGRRNTAMEHKPIRNSPIEKKGRSVAIKSGKTPKRTTVRTAADERPQIPSTPSDDEDPSEEIVTEKKKSGCHVSCFMMCIMCSCYLFSILLFCALGFWLHMHMSYVTSDGEGVSSSDELEISPMNDKGVLPVPELDQETTPLLTQSSYNDTADQLVNVTNDVAVTKQASSSLPPSLAPSYSPSGTPSATTAPTGQPSSDPSASPSWSPTAQPSTSPTITFPPTVSPSSMPSSSPTDSPGCPDRLLKSVALDQSLTMWYEVIVFQGDTFGGMGGLLCVSLEYTGSPAGWIGIAFSEAHRNPQFGRKEAIIGMPGVQTSLAVHAEEAGASIGQQSFGLEDGPQFVNPGKYEIPAGGISEDGREGRGYSGPSMVALSRFEKQTLMNGSISAINSYLTPNDSVSDLMSTRVTFAKYLQEPGEIRINPYRSTLLLYAVAAVTTDGKGEYDGNPEWKETRIKFLESSPDNTKSALVRKRKRHHHIIT